ncbi:MAG: sugar transferase, partial [Thermoanaerobaculia bacterium]
MLPILRHTFTRRIFNTLVFELVALNACFLLLVLSRGLYWSASNFYPVLTGLFAVSNTLVVQFSLWSFGLYSREVVYSGTRVLPNLVGALFFSAFLLLPVCYLFSLSGVHLFGVTLKFYGIVLGGFATLILAERALVLRLFNDSPYMGNILILGTGHATDKLVEEARHHHGKTFRLAGVLSVDPAEVGRAVDGCRVIGTLGDISRVVRQHDIRTILISIPLYSPDLPSEFLLRCKLGGIAVLDSADFYESLGKKVLLEKLDPIQFLLSGNLLMTRFRWALKATTDRLVAVALLLLASPVLLLTALLTKLTSPGPVLYRQPRVGKDGKVFDLLKFRSMVQHAERDGQAVWSPKNDPRVTRLGRIIRKFRIDELPQLINVLRGEMSVVGPRPERPELTRNLQTAIPFYNERHLVPPGITGWAQVAFPYGSSMEDTRQKLRYDLYYIKHMSYFFDGMIALSTVR